MVVIDLETDVIHLSFQSWQVKKKTKRGLPRLRILTTDAKKGKSPAHVTCTEHLPYRHGLMPALQVYSVPSRRKYLQASGDCPGLQLHRPCRHDAPRPIFALLRWVRYVLRRHDSVHLRCKCLRVHTRMHRLYSACTTLYGVHGSFFYLVKPEPSMLKGFRQAGVALTWAGKGTHCLSGSA